MKEEAIVCVPHAQAGVGPLRVVYDLQGLLDAGRSCWTHRATAEVIVAAVVAVRKDSVGKPEDRRTGVNKRRGVQCVRFSSILRCIYLSSTSLKLNDTL